MRATKIFGSGEVPFIRPPTVWNGLAATDWEAIKRVVDSWVQVMRINDDRLVKVVMLEALELGSKVW